MNRIQKRILIFGILVSLLFSAAGCSAGQTGYEDSGENAGNAIGSASEHLLAVWSDYLLVLDQMYSSEMWALDYVEQYLQSGDWKDLTKARAACIASARYLTELSMTKEDLSAQEYLTLANAGVDTGYQSAEFASITDSLKEAHLIIREYFLEGLECDIFYKNSVEILKDVAVVQKEYILCMCRYYCTMTNYLLFSLGDETAAVSYWAALSEKFPFLAAGCAEWMWEENALKTAGVACLDDCESIITKQSDLLSRMNAALYRMTQSVQNNTIQKIRDSAFIMTNIPAFLPMPEWYDPQTAKYVSFFLDESGNIVYPESGDLLTERSYGMYIQIEDIGKEQIEHYFSDVNGIADLTWKEEHSDTWYIVMPDYNVKIDWEDNTAAILFNGEDITFVPNWYIGL